ncbi:hypothetical protein PF010_g2050 [Phytophthora fragariae]|uniref:Uncharacterized protein n=1 Tax=Phytophthora fragariae TaxID=53985 RepID=A0A6G0LY79_9STRA|nr:hypothetical protein PF010_g2050 [Phytophthora fragariae]
MADQDDPVEQLAVQAAAIRLRSAGEPSQQPPWDLRLRIPNPFGATASAAEGEDPQPDEEMQTASPRQDSQRVATAPAIPQPPRYQGLTMKDRRKFMADYETYLAVINTLQTEWAGVLVMPQWVDYFKEAHSPSHVDYGAIDEAMKALRMNTTLPEPGSRMTMLQSDLEDILDEFNVTELAFEHEQRRLVTYLHNAMAPPAFKSVITTRLSLQENRRTGSSADTRRLSLTEKWKK